VNLLYTHGVAKGRLDLQRFVDVASTQAAKYFGLFPKKGTLQPGSDADIVVFDPSYRGIISAKTHHMAVDYSAFEGWPVEGRPSLVTVRGEVMAKDGVFVGKKGHGRFLQRQASHF
jgi:dihydropyrimidinase